MIRRPASLSLAFPVILLASIPATGTRAEDGTPAEDGDFRREIADLRRDVDRLAGSFDAAAARGAGAFEDGEPAPDPRGGIYSKPFLAGGTPRVQVGGYFDVEFRDARNQPHDFRFHRFIPFFYANLHERIRFASELEIEDGSEVELEFAFIDIDIVPQANFRGGVILSPLGKFNLIHDSPINDLTDRPLVDQFVIPTTLREIGAGLFGTLSPDSWDWEIEYEAYATSGFKGLNADGTVAFGSSSGVRDGRASKDTLGTRHFGDNNNSFAGVGRLSVSPVIGSEFGISGHSGDYDELGRDNLTIAALDGLVTIPQFHVADVPVGPIELQGEGAYAFIERDALASASGVPGDLWGYYVQANWHFMPEWLSAQAPALFFPGSTFTFVTRWGQVDLDGNRISRVTIGLNFRPVESTVIKFDYQFNRGTGTSPSSADDDAFLISLASFF